MNAVQGLEVLAAVLLIAVAVELYNDWLEYVGRRIYVADWQKGAGK